MSRKCPKCEEDDLVMIKYRQRSFPMFGSKEWLELECLVCEYRWTKDCADKKQIERGKEEGE